MAEKAQKLVWWVTIAIGILSLLNLYTTWARKPAEGLETRVVNVEIKQREQEATNKELQTKATENRTDINNIKTDLSDIKKEQKYQTSLLLMHMGVGTPKEN